MDTDAAKVLEAIRAADFADSVTPEILQAVYAIEHDKQFEDQRGPVQAALRDLVAQAIHGAP